MVLQHCWNLGYRKVIIESDFQKAIDIINKKDFILHIIIGEERFNGGRQSFRMLSSNGQEEVQIKLQICWQNKLKMVFHFLFIIMYHST